MKDFTTKVRIDSLLSIFHAESGHPGGVLSCIDILSILFKKFLRLDFKNFESIERDRFILSKGHCAPALYAIGANLGWIKSKQLKTLRKLNSKLQGHTDRVSLPWVEASTGSLGQGFSFAIGEALGLELKNINRNVYVMCGDGELQEGEIWEGAMFAGHHKIDNLCAIIDYNKMQSDDLNENIISLEPLKDKWSAFGWHVIEIDGHDFTSISSAFKEFQTIKSTPTVIIANTIKGKGVSFMESVPSWHGSLKLSNEDIFKSLVDLGIKKEKIKAMLDE